MNKARIFLSLTVMMACILSSCSEEAAPKTYFDKYSVGIDYVGGTVEAKVISNGAWTATSTTEGVVITPDSGYGNTPITVEVPENSENVTVAVRVLVTTSIGESAYAAKFVVALEARPFVYCEENSASAPAAGGVVWFFVNSNNPWSVVESKYGDGSEFDGTIVPSQWDVNGVYVAVEVPENTTGMARTISIKLQLDDYSFAKEELTITQSE